ncbi:MAG: hypothetical protein DMG89_12180, partial [Acidobacteria bacterium]
GCRTGPNRWLVETIFHRDVIQREISRVLVLNLLAKTRCSALQRRSLSLTTPSLLSRGSLSKFGCQEKTERAKVGQPPERVQILGGVSIAMAHDVAETTQIERPPKGREEVPVQLSRLIDAHQIIIRQCRSLASRASELGDDGTNDMIVSDVLRTNEMHLWFLSEHLVEMPLVKAED